MLYDANVGYIEDMENDVPTQMEFVGAFASQLLYTAAVQES